MRPKNVIIDADASAKITNMRLILDSEIIIKDIIGLCPSIIELSTQNIIQLSILIKAYIFSRDQIIEIIGKITQCEDVIEYIEGLGIIIEEEGIRDIAEIDNYLSSIQKQIIIKNENSEIEDIISFP